MGKLVLFNMMSLDGFFEGPSGEIDWHNVDSEFNEFAIEQLNSAAALVFGRKTYELMASYWPDNDIVNDDPVVAGLMNNIPKFVFSKTLRDTDWNNTKLINEDAPDACRELKKNFHKDIFIFGSAQLASSLIDAGLIDEFRIMINPVILGGGKSLFRQHGGRIKLSLIRTKAFSSGNVMCVYKPQ
jgi:dihydrofolate reductase